MLPKRIVHNLWFIVYKKEIFLSILSAVLLTLSFPVFNIELLAWVGFIPLFFAIQGKSKGGVFLLSYFTGILFWLGTIYWIAYVSFLGLFLLVLYLALYFGLFGFLFKFGIRDVGFPTIIIPAIWIFLEWIRSNLFTGFGWGLLGYSQYLNLPIIQIADITGVWGVSFLVMMVNVSIWQSLLRIKYKRAKAGKGYIISVLFPLLFLFCAMGYGFYNLSNSRLQTPSSKLRISVIQGNIPQHQKWDEDFKNSILERYAMLAREAAGDRPDLIIWPETAVPGVIYEEAGLLENILKLAKEIETPLFIGAVTNKAGRYYNSAILISGQGEVISQYNKIHLVPFGEYIPFERCLSFIRRWINTPIGDFSSDREYTIFGIQARDRMQNIRFGVLICFEDIFPYLVKRFTVKKTDFMVNITNDAWFTPPINQDRGALWKRWAGFMRSSAPYQHAQASVFRAVENRIPVVRAANTGLSCFIDRNGRIYDKVIVDKEDIFVIGYKTAEVLLSR